MSMFQKLLLYRGKRARAGTEKGRAQRVIKLDDNTYQIVWADEYDKWVSFFKDSGKLK
ncbi:MAG: hypothetical protein ACP5UH_03255 [Candidatus Micrarchaeia archaeon]